MLPGDACENLPHYGNAERIYIWVLSAERARECPLDGATFVDRYYADRSRTSWEIWDVTALTTTADGGP